MLSIARAALLLAMLVGCGSAPPNPTPCEREGYGSQACQIYMYSRAGM